MNSTWKSFEEARAYARSLGLKSQAKWQQWSKLGKRPSNIPSNPHLVYKQEWKGFGDWLGVNRGSWMPFKAARAYVRGRGFKSRAEWCGFSRSGKRSPRIPSSPHLVYEQEWKGMRDWLGV